MRFLLFTLYAPMGSLGEIAVGERRMSWARPGRSAVFGLAAGALGYDRGDEGAHRSLEAGLYYAVRTDAPGRPFIDYHTVQTPKARKGRTFATRKAELDSDGLHTVVSRREWRSDACFTVALWRRADSAVDLDGLAEALRRPWFTLYLGRKSAPLGLPLDPAIVEADTFIAAFKARRRNEAEEAVLNRICSDGAPWREIASDADAPGAREEGRIETRRDAVVGRARWRFTDRLERIVPWEGGGE